MNLWGDLPMTFKRDGMIVGQLTDEEYAAILTDEWQGRPGRTADCFSRPLA